MTLRALHVDVTTIGLPNRYFVCRGHASTLGSISVDLASSSERVPCPTTAILLSELFLFASGGFELGREAFDVPVRASLLACLGAKTSTSSVVGNLSIDGSSICGCLTIDPGDVALAGFSRRVSLATAIPSAVDVSLVSVTSSWIGTGGAEYRSFSTIAIPIPFLDEAVRKAQTSRTILTTEDDVVRLDRVVLWREAEVADDSFTTTEVRA